MTPLKSLRTAAGLTQAQLAIKAGISKRTLEQYENGRNDTANAQAHIIIKLADALNVHPRELINDKKPEH